MPKMVDLFCGTKSMAKAFERAGWETYTVDWEESFEPTLQADIGTLTSEDIIKLCGGVPDVIWASFDCATFSVAAIGHHRRKNLETGNLDPISEYAKFCDNVDQNVLRLINELKPTYFWIENPRGGLRKMTWMQDIPYRYTTTYCQWGEKRMKPTDLFTNYPDAYFPCCKNGDKCHEAAPRGSRTGTQGIKGAKDRSRIPDALCDYIVELCERNITIQND
jgi:hypothetical protein